MYAPIYLFHPVQGKALNPLSVSSSTTTNRLECSINFDSFFFHFSMYFIIKINLVCFKMIVLFLYIIELMMVHVYY
jgi:hypothetical protein